MPFSKLVIPLFVLASCSFARDKVLVPKSPETTAQTPQSSLRIDTPESVIQTDELPGLSKVNTAVTSNNNPTTAAITYNDISKDIDHVEAKKYFDLSPELRKYCHQLEAKFSEYKWGEPRCSDFNWNHVRNSDLGTPLVWTVFGDEVAAQGKENTTLILCGVHGDEITPIKFCWDLMNELKLSSAFADKLVVIAPLVSPDSFLKDRPTRTNGRGVDVNRNFPTADWHTDAHKRWKYIMKGDKRKFPGPKAASEQETIFQMNLILRYKPNKVISVHAPLTLLDYDGPSLKAEKGKSAKALLDQMSSKASGYKVSNYPIFPGSLGNWAGKEKHIPTYTLELPNSNPLETQKFWSLFKDAVLFAVDHKMKPPVD